MIACGLATHYLLKEAFFISMDYQVFSWILFHMTSWFDSFLLLTEASLDWGAAWKTDDRWSWSYWEFSCTIWWSCLPGQKQCSSQVRLLLVFIPEWTVPLWVSNIVYHMHCLIIFFYTFFPLSVTISTIGKLFLCIKISQSEICCLYNSAYRLNKWVFAFIVYSFWLACISCQDMLGEICCNATTVIVWWCCLLIL